MNLSDDETGMLRGMRAITLDAEGQQIFVGLDATESEEFLALTRRNETGENLQDDPRFNELHDRHETARRSIVMGEAPLDPSVHLR